MKKSLVALATLAAASGAFAQSSVTLFGVMDAAYTYGRSDTDSKTSMTTSSLNSSRFGVRGEEDLGSGLKAGFHLEASVANDSGAGSATNHNNQAVTALTSAGTQGLTFGRRSTLSLMGGAGELRVGRDYTPHFWNHTVYDPFGTNGVGASMANANSSGASTNYTGVRASNSIAYHSPSFNGFKAQLMTYMGENASTSAKTGSGNSLRATYDAGPLSLGIATGKTTTGTGTSWKATNYGGSFDLTVAKVMAVYSIDKVSGSNDIKGYLVGATAPVGSVGLAKLAFSESKQGAAKSGKTALGYVHNLSKRTSVYGTYAVVTNKGGASIALGGATGAANKNSTGFDLGLSHSF